MVHPMVKNKAHSLTLWETFNISRCLEKQLGEIDVYTMEPKTFYMMVETEDVEESDREASDIIKDFKKKYWEEHFAVLVLYEEDKRYVSARLLTNFPVALREQLSQEEIDQKKQSILYFFNTDNEEDGIRYFMGLMKHCAEAGFWLGTSAGNSYNDAYNNDNSYNSYNGYDKYGNYGNYAGYDGSDEWDEYDEGSEGIFDYDVNDQVDTGLDYHDLEAYDDYVNGYDDPYDGYDNGYYDGYDAGYEDRYDNNVDGGLDYHDLEEYANDDYDFGYEDGYDTGYDDAYHEDDYSYEEFFDDHYGDFMDDGGY